MNDPAPSSTDSGPGSIQTATNNMPTTPTSHGVDLNTNIANIGSPTSRIQNIDGLDFANALIRRPVQDQFAVAHARQISQQLLELVAPIIRHHALLLSGIFTTASLAALLPSLAVVIVNAVGFTSGGVVAGSLAAAIQSQFFGAFTGGVFSSLQAFGATAVVASPAVLVLGGVSLAVGVGMFGWWLHKKRKRSRLSIMARNENEDDDRKNK